MVLARPDDYDQTRRDLHGGEVGTVTGIGDLGGDSWFVQLYPGGTYAFCEHQLDLLVELVPDDLEGLEAMGDACPDEGCPHYGTPHGHVEPSDAVVAPHHYARFKIEPINFIMQNDLPFAIGNVIKYVCRYDAKNGIEDLEKAKRYIDFQIALLRGDGSVTS